MPESNGLNIGILSKKNKKRQHKHVLTFIFLYFKLLS